MESAMRFDVCTSAGFNRGVAFVRELFIVAEATDESCMVGWQLKMLLEIEDGDEGGTNEDELMQRIGMWPRFVKEWT